MQACPREGTADILRYRSWVGGSSSYRKLLELVQDSHVAKEWNRIVQAAGSSARSAARSRRQCGSSRRDGESNAGNDWTWRLIERVEV